MLFLTTGSAVIEVYNHLRCLVLSEHMVYVIVCCLSEGVDTTHNRVLLT